MAAVAADLLTLVRKRVNVNAVHSDARKPFRFLLCGEPALVAAFRSLLLAAREDANVPLDAASTLETVDPLRRTTLMGPDIRCAIFFGRPGDGGEATADALRALGVPVFAIVVDPAVVAPSGPASAPLAGEIAEYVVPRLDRDALRGRVFPHVIDRCKGVEVAVGRRLPAMRETVAAKLTRDAASSALKMAAASAVVDHVPLLGIVLGAVASAGDMVAITGIQIVLMLQIGATYGKDPDVQRIWELLPVVGGGLGWRALSREISGFIPVAGVAIKGAIAYAGTIVVGEGVGFFYEHGRHMTAAQAGVLYEEKKRAALTFARDLVTRLRSKS
ncbi:MAG: hypothetical protein IAI48_08275 [Candidatus Eremiobacteraeota bacterium]|jgi:uncharacterized protein (DUF697 family)|nr:hypothetical protein [Candidatus Eremiobacteraeota bacterium]